MFTIVKVFFTFLESLTSKVTPIFSNSIKNLKSSVRNVTDIFATQEEYLSKPHLNRIKWREVTAN